MRIAALVLGCGVAVSPTLAHPGSGIVADKDGVVYFLDTGAGVWKIGAGGALTKVPGGQAFHWMAIDPDGRFAKGKLPSGSGWQIARTIGTPSILLSSDTPIAIGRNGNLYYPTPSREGGVVVLQVAPDGATKRVASLHLRWLNGLAVGPDGSIYTTEARAIRKIAKDGKVTTVAERVEAPGCAAIPGTGDESAPYLRGLDVDASGNVYVAAAGCGSVLKIAPDGKVSKLLQMEAPWSPTAVVRVGSDLYVLEYLHTEGEDRRRWVPRVRKLGADGQSAVVATVKRTP